MGVYRICRAFTVESGHQLSKHAEGCRYPHGHTRRIEVVISSVELDSNEMVVDFKALKLALKPHLEVFDHSLAINSADPMAPTLIKAYPEGVVVFEDQDPTTEILARDIFETLLEIFKKGWTGKSDTGVTYQIPARKLTLERVRVWETPNSWAEYGL